MIRGRKSIQARCRKRLASWAVVFWSHYFLLLEVKLNRSGLQIDKLLTFFWTDRIPLDRREDLHTNQY